MCRHQSPFKTDIASILTVIANDRLHIHIIDALQIQLFNQDNTTVRILKTLFISFTLFSRLMVLFLFERLSTDILLPRTIFHRFQRWHHFFIKRSQIRCLQLMIWLLVNLSLLLSKLRLFAAHFSMFIFFIKCLYIFSAG